MDQRQYGKALKFDGEEDCVSVPNSEALQLSEEFTVEAWVKPEGSLSSEPLIFKESEGGPSYALGLGFNSAGKPEGYAEGESIASPSTIETNVWTHLAYTYDGARMRLYVNGEQVASKYVGSETLASTGPLDIGCAAAFNEYFNGKIDEARIYDRALNISPESIAKMNQLPSCEAPTDQQMVESRKELKDGGYATVYSFEGMTVELPTPPGSFDPLSASAEELEEYGFPPRPTDPEALAE